MTSRPGFDPVSVARWLPCALIGTALAALATIAAATPNLEGMYDLYRAGNIPRSFRLHDLNGDGYDDAIVVNAPGSVTVLSGDADGGFQIVAQMNVGANPVGAAAGDVNNDGVGDIVVANHGSGTLSLFLGMPGNAFQPQVLLECGASPHFVEIVDLNNDGNRDLVAVNYGPDSVSVLLGAGDGGFGSLSKFATAPGAFSMAAGDVNGDGNVDVLTASLARDGVAVLLGRGDGTLLPARVSPAGPGVLAFAIGDLDGDPYPDIATANQRDHTMTTLRGVGDGNFAQVMTLPSPTYPFSVDIEDVNGDGYGDVAIAAYFSDRILVFKGRGFGMVEPPSDHYVPSQPLAVAISEVTGDGNPDLLTIGSTTGTLAVLPGDGSGGFGRRNEYPVGSGSDPRAVAAADLDGDKLIDLATANRVVSTATVLGALPEGGYAPGVHYPTDGASVELAAGDLDGDGIGDLVVLNQIPYGVGSVSVLRGVVGGFIRLPSFPIHANVEAVEIARFDNDDHPDLLLHGPQRAFTARGIGDGTFETPVLHEQRVVAAAAGDVDQDGLDDLVINVRGQCCGYDHAGYCICFISRQLYVKRSLGDGTFGAPIVSPIANSFWAMTLADADNDGALDVVGGTGQGLSVMRGAGDGSFSAEINSPGMPNAHHIAVADLDGDGDRDAVATHGGSPSWEEQYQSSFLAVYVGNGAGGFTIDRRFFAFGGLISRPIIVDSDRDSWPDVAVATTRGTVFLLMNRTDRATPVAISLVEATGEDGIARITWYAGAGGMSSGNVERLIDDNWRTVGAPTVNGTGFIHFEEGNLHPGVHAFRLRYADDDGVDRWTTEVFVEVALIRLSIESIQPNPMTGGWATLNYVLPKAGPGVIEVFDVQGRRRDRRATGTTIGQHTARIQAGTDWKPGVFVVRLSQGDVVVQKSVAIMR